MDPYLLPIMVGGNLLLGGVALVYIRKLRRTSLLNFQETEKRERELKRWVLELQVLRSLSERVGYSLDLRKILEVIIESLGGLVNFATVSYMLLETEGRITFKIHAESGVSRAFLDQVKLQMLEAFSVMTNQKLQPGLVEEISSGVVPDDHSTINVTSFFNLPIVVGGKIVALINVSSPEKNLYGDEETAILYTILNQVSSHAGKLSQVVENEKRRLSAMISSLTDGVIMVDTLFNPIVANKAVATLLGLERENNLFAIFSAVGGKADLRSAIEQSISTRSVIRLVEFELNQRAIQIDVEPVKDKFGYLLGAVVVLHDVTSARQVEKMREDFTAMMVHELRTPLTTITYSTDMMLSDLSKLTQELIGQNLEIIKSTTSSMLSLVNELLDIAKMEAGKFIIVKQSGNLDQLITDKIKMFKPLADQKKLQLQYSPEKILPQLPFDAKRIGQVLDNLLSNALKYTDHGGVTVGSQVFAGKEILISVTDTGDGIKAEDLDKLFSKFEQLGKGKTGERGGTGLGLVVSKGIVEAHGGRIWAESKGVGKGTTFSFTLPL